MGYDVTLNFVLLMQITLLVSQVSGANLRWCACRFRRLFSRVMNTGSQFVMEGVKNLVLKQHVSIYANNKTAVH